MSTTDKTDKTAQKTTKVDDVVAAARDAHRKAKIRLQLAAEDTELHALQLSEGVRKVRMGFQVRQATAHDRIVADMSERLARAAFINDMSQTDRALLTTAQAVLKGTANTDKSAKSDTDPKVGTPSSK